MLPDLEALVDRVLDLAEGAHPQPFPLILLVREYKTTGRSDVAALVEQALAGALAVYGDG